MRVCVIRQELQLAELGRSEALKQAELAAAEAELAMEGVSDAAAEVRLGLEVRVAEAEMQAEER